MLQFLDVCSSLCVFYCSFGCCKQSYFLASLVSSSHTLIAELMQSSMLTSPLLLTNRLTTLFLGCSTLCYLFFFCGPDFWILHLAIHSIINIILWCIANINVNYYTCENILSLTTNLIFFTFHHINSKLLARTMATSFSMVHNKTPSF